MSPDGEQQDLLPGLRAAVAGSRARARDTRARKAASAEPAAELPVARVLVDVPLAHLDREFDYLVPAALAEAARPGVRVKVRFAGHDVDGYVLERVERSDHGGTLTPLRRVVSPEPVLSPAVAGLAADLAARYAGVRSDVVRLAVPPRHAATEKAPAPGPAAPRPLDREAASAAWAHHEHAPAFLERLAAGERPRAVWTAAPGDDWPTMLAHAVAAASHAGRGSLLCVPDGKDVARVDAALGRVLGPDRHVVLTSGAGPAARYRDFLAVSRGARRVVVGTRAASFAPVHDLGLVVVWDDGDDLLVEPRAPYPHVRETLLTRAEREGAAALVAGFSRSVEAQYLLRTGWAGELAPHREVLRRRVSVRIAGADERAVERDPHGARVPHEVHRTVRAALVEGPVLVQTPRAGYAVGLACDRCRTPARCSRCAGPLRLPDATAPPACGWCGTAEPAWACGACGHRGLRAPVLGDARTADELGRAFPRTRVRTSSRDQVLERVGREPALVVATPGAEPVADGGYTAIVLLDCGLMLARADLRVAEEALRRWANAVGLARPGAEVVAVGDPGHPALQALVRGDHAGLAEREIAERQEAHLPPASRVATITGPPGALDDALTLLSLPEHAEVLGPVRVDDEEDRVVLRVPRAGGAALSSALGELQRVRSARKLDPVRVRVDPPELL